MIERPEPADLDGAPRRGSYLSLLLAAVLALAVFLGLFFLTLGAIGPMVIIGGGIFALAAFHYLVWGWWLGRIIRDEADENDSPS